MTPESVILIGQEAIKVTALIATPILGSALTVGLLVGMFQAATQIQEATLSFIPKLAIMAFTLMTAGSWMLNLLVNFTRRLIGNIPLLIG
ncbi:MAG: flagellar biosynthesis protein FliQ [Gammaproteobacteria bacterium]|nr:flagellar biosynthesis protein FliQ [Gammaproteobacteria bacterium]NNJ93187.1 flagellar biosynthesis protein FliQ [Halobacteria archaeon]